MANLATMIMEGTAILGNTKLAHKYDHIDGPALIAMESAQALRDIFEVGFYENNACTLKAVAEGYTDFDSSPYAATMEGIIADAFQKVKDFLIKLKDKVIAFFHSMIRYLQGIFMDGKKWVTKYEKELNAIRNKLKDYEVSMYDYIDLDTAPDYLVKGYTDVENAANDILRNTGDVVMKDATGTDRNDDKIDELYRDYVKDDLKVSNFTSADDDLSKECWSYFRKGADSDADKEKKEVSSIFSDAIKALKDSDKSVSKLNKALTSADNMFKKVVKNIENKADEYDKEANKADVKQDEKDKKSHSSEQCRAVASLVSRCQSAANTYMNAWKAALTERNKAYQSALVGAFAYARKNKD